VNLQFYLTPEGGGQSGSRHSARIGARRALEGSAMPRSSARNSTHEIRLNSRTTGATLLRSATIRTRLSATACSRWLLALVQYAMFTVDPRVLLSARVRDPDRLVVELGSTTPANTLTPLFATAIRLDAGGAKSCPVCRRFGHS